MATNIAFRDGSTTNPGGTGCPTLQFLIGSYLIKVDGATQFVGGFCRDLQPGVKVGVKGAVNADGSVTASAISVRTETSRPEPEAEGEGFVTGLVADSACPALQFKISEYTITLTASTVCRRRLHQRRRRQEGRRQRPHDRRKGGHRIGDRCQELSSATIACTGT